MIGRFARKRARSVWFWLEWWEHVSGKWIAYGGADAERFSEWAEARIARDRLMRVGGVKARIVKSEVM